MLRTPAPLIGALGVTENSMKSFSALRTAALAICLSLTYCSLAAEPSGSMTVATFLDLGKNAVDHSAGSPVVTLYLTAALDAFGFANTTLDDEKKPLLYCEPKNLTLNTINLRQMLNASIAKTKSNLSESDWNQYAKIMNISAELLGLLQEAFPCHQ